MWTTNPTSREPTTTSTGTHVIILDQQDGRLKKAAEDTDLAKKVIFAIVHRDDFKDEIEKFGLTNKDGSFAIDDHVNNQKYRSTEEFSGTEW
jgi:hypothetical protein